MQRPMRCMRRSHTHRRRGCSHRTSESRELKRTGFSSALRNFTFDVWIEARSNHQVRRYTLSQRGASVRAFAQDRCITAFIASNVLHETCIDVHHLPKRTERIMISYQLFLRFILESFLETAVFSIQVRQNLNKTIRQATQIRNMRFQGLTRVGVLNVSCGWFIDIWSVLDRRRLRQARDGFNRALQGIGMESIQYDCVASLFKEVA
mmetsp:Transcript_5489/g.21423  ORF Transcript_5489/g.21423 Transcript_5489/m.21423 type:complete len:207 (+) Transcript_5489:1395-2015(+)